MAKRESKAEAALRWQKLELLQKHYATFDVLLSDVMENLMGFQCSDIQKDIGEFLSQGPKRAMIQAQRGQAKTTITAIYAVWCLIHDPTMRVLIVSAGGPLAKEISNWIIQIINFMDELECMRPDSANGDRESVEAFDVHYTLKGPEKSPSVACMGITSSIQGKRADLLIADDIESSKNSRTATQREIIKELTKDFTSICSKGKIVYLGTPQSIDSVYNSLPSRGYVVRVWPGRYPTPDEMQNYGTALAPLLMRRIELDPTLQTGGGPKGDRGQAVDPVILNEEALLEKEIDQGAAYFQLQHMLDTKLMDADRYPLKPEHLLFMSIPKERVPLQLYAMQSNEYLLPTPTDFPIDSNMYEIAKHGDEWAEFTGTHIYFDPSGGGKNGDELAWAVTKFRSGYIYLMDVGGVPGGLHETNQKIIADLVYKWKPSQVDFEDNFGAGTFRQIMEPIILKKFENDAHACGIEGVWETGQKELRIIDILEPIISGNKLVVDKSLIGRDWAQCERYGIEDRPTYSFFFQLARLTRDRGSLAHDDRLDAVAGSCRHWNDLLSADKDKEAAKATQERYNKMMRDPLGDGSNLGAKQYHKTRDMINLFDRLRR